jgi:hypothetical protein
LGYGRFAEDKYKNDVKKQREGKSMFNIKPVIKKDEIIG